MRFERRRGWVPTRILEMRRRMGGRVSRSGWEEALGVGRGFISVEVGASRRGRGKGQIMMISFNDAARDLDLGDG
jgi:hypothetical protein